MSDLLRMTVIGRCGRDPEQKQLPSGDMVCNVSVAASERWKDKSSGEQKERTTWVNCSFWGGLAEVAQRYLAKGKQVYVEGVPAARAWKDKSSGDAKAALELRVTNLIMLGSRGDSAPPEPAEPKKGKALNRPEPQEGFQGDDDIPF